MGYLFLVVALFGGVIKAYCGKCVGNASNDENDMMTANFFRMILCSVIGFFIAYISEGNICAFQVNKTVFFISLLSGIFTALFVTLWLMSIKHGAYTMVDIFVMLGTIVPVAGSTLILNGSVNIIQCIGFAVVVASTIGIYSYNNTIKKKPTTKQIFLLFMLALASGFADFTQKLFVAYSDGTSNAVFNFYTYVFSALFILAILLFKKTNMGNALRKNKSAIIYTVFMAIGLFINSFFKVEAARFIEAEKLYPLNQGAALLLGMIMADVFFGEKINLKCVASIILGFIGLCLINLF